MIYLKKYENFDFDDFDFEEEPENNWISIQKGTLLPISTKVMIKPESMYHHQGKKDNKYMCGTVVSHAKKSHYNDGNNEPCMLKYIVKWDNGKRWLYDNRDLLYNPSLTESFDFDDDNFDWDEKEEFIEDSEFKIGDIIKSNHNTFQSFNFKPRLVSGQNYRIVDIDDKYVYLIDLLFGKKIPMRIVYVNKNFTFRGRKYESFQWDEDDFDFEEESPIEFKVNDNVYLEDNIEYWNSGGITPKFNTFPSNGDTTHRIMNIKHSSEITEDNEHKIPKGSIPYNDYMVILSSMWPWFKIDKLVKV